jgi:hypothetical protein
MNTHQVADRITGEIVTDGLTRDAAQAIVDGQQFDFLRIYGGHDRPTRVTRMLDIRPGMTVNDGGPWRVVERVGTTVHGARYMTFVGTEVATETGADYLFDVATD